MPNWVSLLKVVPWQDVIANAPAVASGAKKLWKNVAGRVEGLAEGPEAGPANPAQPAAATPAAAAQHTTATPPAADSAAAEAPAWATPAQLEAVAVHLSAQLTEQLAGFVTEQLTEAAQAQAAKHQATQQQVAALQEALAATQAQVAQAQARNEALSQQLDALASRQRLGVWLAGVAGALALGALAALLVK